MDAVAERLAQKDRRDRGIDAAGHAQMTAPVGAAARIAATFSLAEPAIVQSGSTPQMRKRKFSRISRAVRRCGRTSGWNWMA